jgi:hypothetical protein
MSVSANNGNAFLDDYARQINQLEKDPNATPEYGKKLEEAFAAIKAQVLGSGSGQTADRAGVGHRAATSGSGSGGGGAPPSEKDAYQKLLHDLQSGADHDTILADSAQLAIAAAAKGDTYLEGLARNVGNSIGDGSYGQQGSIDALKNAVPGTAGAKNIPAGPFAQPDDVGNAYLKLESDVEHGADAQTLKADAEQVKALSQKDGNSHLVAAADGILNGIANGTYNKLAAEKELMKDGATHKELGFDS